MATPFTSRIIIALLAILSATDVSGWGWPKLPPVNKRLQKKLVNGCSRAFSELSSNQRDDAEVKHLIGLMKAGNLDSVHIRLGYLQPLKRFAFLHYFVSNWQKMSRAFFEVQKEGYFSSEIIDTIGHFDSDFVAEAFFMHEVWLGFNQNPKMYIPLLAKLFALYPPATVLKCSAKIPGRETGYQLEDFDVNERELFAEAYIAFEGNYFGLGQNRDEDSTKPANLFLIGDSPVAGLELFRLSPEAQTRLMIVYAAKSGQSAVAHVNKLSHLSPEQRLEIIKAGLKQDPLGVVKIVIPYRITLEQRKKILEWVEEISEAETKAKIKTFIANDWK